MSVVDTVITNIKGDREMDREKERERERERAGEKERRNEDTVRQTRY